MFVLAQPPTSMRPAAQRHRSARNARCSITACACALGVCEEHAWRQRGGVWGEMRATRAAAGLGSARRGIW